MTTRTSFIPSLIVGIIAGLQLAALGAPKKTGHPSVLSPFERPILVHERHLFAAKTPSETVTVKAAASKLAAPFKVDHRAPLKLAGKIVEENKNFAKFRIEFNGIEGDRVPAHLYLPKNIKGRLPAVLVQHGINNKKHSEYIVECAKMLNARGIIAMAIDAPARGERKGPNNRGPKMFDLPAVNQWYRQHCSDYSRALDYLETRPDVDAKRLGFVGFSWGAITGITFTAHDPRVKAMTSVVGGGLIGLLGKELDPIFNVGRIAPRPLLFINAKRDRLVWRPLATALHNKAGKNAVVKWYDTDHTFSTMDRMVVMKKIADFMRDKLPHAKTPNGKVPKE